MKLSLRSTVYIKNYKVLRINIKFYFKRQLLLFYLIQEYKIILLIWCEFIIIILKGSKFNNPKIVNNRLYVCILSCLPTINIFLIPYPTYKIILT